VEIVCVAHYPGKRPVKDASQFAIKRENPRLRRPQAHLLENAPAMHRLGRIYVPRLFERNVL
jgi:hypothetical protein